MKTPLVILDPGHGGRDSGAVGPTGLRESDVVLEDALMLRGMLEDAGIDVDMTRDSDRFYELNGRATFANERDADFFLSLHANSYSDPGAHGFEVFTSPGETAADPFASALFESYEVEFQGLAARKNLSDGDPDKEARFTVLTQTQMPAALFELEFISNPRGERWLADAEARRRRVRALFHGIQAHLRDIDRLPAATPEESSVDDLDTSTSNLARARAKIAAGRDRIKEGLELLG